MKRFPSPIPLPIVALLAVALGLGPALGLAAAELPRLKTFELADQFGHLHRLEFPRDKPLLLLVGDRRGSEEVDSWIAPLKQHWGAQTDLAGIADVSAAPRFLRGRILEGIRKQRPRPLMLDFEGTVTEPLRCTAKTANLLVVDRDGRTLLRFTGKPDDAKLAGIRAALTSTGVTNSPAPAAAPAPAP